MGCEKKKCSNCSQAGRLGFKGAFFFFFSRMGEAGDGRSERNRRKVGEGIVVISL